MNYVDKRYEVSVKLRFSEFEEGKEFDKYDCDTLGISEFQSEKDPGDNLEVQRLRLDAQYWQAADQIRAMACMLRESADLLEQHISAPIHTEVVDNKK